MRRCDGPAWLLGLALAAPAAAGADVAPADKLALSRWGGVGAVVAWGLVQWDYGAQGLHLASEGWFQHDTPEGGADKLGHLYTGYVLGRAFGSLYRRWDLSEAEAARQAALTSLLMTTTIEVGDGFSPYGISWEDMAMNALGAWASHALMREPAWRERLDLRVEYEFNSDARDISTDYENARFLVALKLAGFAPLRDTPLQWLELHGGYYARGYPDPQAPDRRYAYVGVGLNLSRLLRQAGFDGGATFLQFYQPPSTSWRAEQGL